MVRAQYKVDPQRTFSAAVDRARTDVLDLTIPLRLILEDFYRSNRATFEKRGAGGYEDLSDKYKARKRRQVGFVYPILVRSGALRGSATNSKDRNAYSRIINRSAIEFGSRLPYAAAVQSRRPFMFFGPEYPKIASSEQTQRLERWVKILEEHVVAVSRFGKAA